MFLCFMLIFKKESTIKSCKKNQKKSEYYN
jgi:hypothetical protein